jgi:prophage DNA circulation protein
MTWRDDFQEGSFRGAAFLISESRATFGRRNQVHEYPQQDKPWAEDLGKSADRWTIECFVVGEDYFSDRDALIAALKAAGSGTLVHPYLGTIDASLETPAEVTESTDHGGMASFSLSFVESGADTAPAGSPDTQGAADAAADDVQTTADTSAAGDLDVAGQPGFVIQGAQDVLSAAGDAIGQALAVIQAPADALFAIQQQVAGLASNGLALLQAPADLVGVLFGAIGAIGDLAPVADDALSALCGSDVFAAAPAPVAVLPDGVGPTGIGAVIGADGVETLPPIGGFGLGTLPPVDRFTPGAAAAPLGGLFGFGATLAPVRLGTPARAVQAANQAAIVRLVQCATAAAAVKVVADMPFNSYEDAAGVRDALADQLDAVAMALADSGDDALAASVDVLRTAMIADVTARGGSLASLYGYTPAKARPAVVIAQGLYLDATRAEDILARNYVEHPGFVPGGQVLEVLSA